ncbi:MAG TPA: EthD family reductase [Acidobacteriaceae bacterium]|nr:EthD family reductase [Acidobacteriaceae bacterium]
MAVAVTVVYPKTDASHFDYEYYAAKHIPLVHARWDGLGLVRAEFLRGVSQVDGATADYALLGTLVFDSTEAVHAALSAHGAEIMGDIPNYTNVQPFIQINELFGK